MRRPYLALALVVSLALAFGWFVWPTRYEYVLTANYTLVSAATGAPVKRGRARAQVTYDSADQPYASITAQQDAQDRAAAECAQKIQVEIAAWLATQGKS